MSGLRHGEIQGRQFIPRLYHNVLVAESELSECIQELSRMMADCRRYFSVGSDAL